jgi:hypothetical protein
VVVKAVILRRELEEPALKKGPGAAPPAMLPPVLRAAAGCPLRLIDLGERRDDVVVAA